MMLDWQHQVFGYILYERSLKYKGRTLTRDDGLAIPAGLDGGIEVVSRSLS